MSTAHRPTWDPAQAKDVKGGSRQFSVRDMAAHTKLKFRFVLPSMLIINTLSNVLFPPSQVGQTSAGEVKTRDLRADLLAAEQEARNKKRKAEGKPPLAVEDSSTVPVVDEEANKRRKLLQEALELDKDDDDEKDGEDSKMKADEDDDDERCVMVGSVINNELNLSLRAVLAKKTLTTRKTIRLSFCANSKRSNGKGQKRKLASRVNRMRQTQRRGRRTSPLRIHS